MDKFLIIDGNSLAFRAYFALPFLTTQQGQPSGAIFGFLNMFTKVLDEFQPTHIAVAFDFSRKTFRNDIYAEYKGTRSETPPELRSQFPILKDVLNTMGIKVIEQQGIEADDIIGTLAKSTSCFTTILSGDKDVLQLIDETTQVWLTQKGISEIYKVDKPTLLRDFKLYPNQIVDLKALMGDNSDNIPGVMGIGPKTATNLIQQFNNVEGVYENLDNPNISKNIKEKLIADKSSAFLSKILATIKQDCNIELDFESFRLNLPFNEQTTEIIQELNMASLLKKTKYFMPAKIQEPIYEDINNVSLENFEINSINDLQNVCSQNDITICAINLGKDLVFSFNKEKYYTIASEITLFNQAPELEESLTILKPILENKNIHKIVYDYKKCKRVLAKYNINLQGEIFDINLANYIIGGKKVEAENVKAYFVIKNNFEKQLKKDNMLKLYYDIELPLEDVLYDMENAGFKVDRQLLESYKAKIEKEIEILIKDIYELAGENFNINSPKQLSEILFTKLNLSSFNNKKKSTGVDILVDLQGEHPIIDKIIQYRKVQKIKSTYIDAFLNLINQNGEIIHTMFNQTLTTTGRLSSSEPNLQNLPVREEEGKELRKVFVSRFDNGKIVSADYNQIELRLLAHCSEDETLINAFNNNQDIHKLTASQIFNKPQNEITSAERRDAKAVNFGIVYGISDFGLSQNVKISKRDAQEYIDKYFLTYPKVKVYMDNNVEFAKKFGYIKTIFERRRYIPEISSQNYTTRLFGTRVAMNMPLQGSASDIIKIAMLKVQKELKNQNLKSILILQIHDELVLDCPQEEVEQVEMLLKNAMENVIDLKVKLPVEIESGDTYFDV